MRFVDVQDPPLSDRRYSFHGRRWKVSCHTVCRAYDALEELVPSGDVRGAGTKVLGLDPIFGGQPTPSCLELALYTAATGLCAWSGQRIRDSAREDS